MSRGLEDEFPLNYLLRVIFTLTHYSDIVSDMPSESIYQIQYSIYIYIMYILYSDILSDILSGIYSDVLSGISSDILSGILFGIYFAILSGIYSDILSDMGAALRKPRICKLFAAWHLVPYAHYYLQHGSTASQLYVVSAFESHNLVTGPCLAVYF